MVGAGAIGSSVAADLIDAGLALTVVDQWPAHVDAMRSSGLEVTMPDRAVHVEVDAHHVCDLASVKPTFDIVFTAVDAYDTAWIARLVEHYLAADGVLIGIQNSMTTGVVERIVGRDRTLGCVVELSAQLFTPGVVQRNTTRAGTWMAVGELNGAVTPRLEFVAELLSNAARTDTTTNIYGAKWTKLVSNCMMMGPYALFGLKEQDASRLPGMTEISASLGREAAAVGEALGYRLEPIFGLTADDFSAGGDDVLMKALTKLIDDVGEHALNTMIQDQLKGRRSEFNEINGLVARHGEEHGIDTPANNAVVELSRRIDEGDLDMGPENLSRLQAMLGED